MAANSPCRQCGSWSNLTIDHIDPSLKSPLLCVKTAKRSTSRIWAWSQERRDRELANCQVLCDPCHVEKTRLEHLAKNRANV